MSLYKYSEKMLPSKINYPNNFLGYTCMNRLIFAIASLKLILLVNANDISWNLKSLQAFI